MLYDNNIEHAIAFHYIHDWWATTELVYKYNNLYVQVI